MGIYIKRYVKYKEIEEILNFNFYGGVKLIK